MYQMNFILFVALAASALWICLAAWRGLQSLRKMHAMTLVAFLALSGVLAVIGDKTNGLMRVIGPLRSPPPVAVTVTPDDIARGWRIESVGTNEAMSYAMPTNAVHVGNWHIHGARSSLGNHKVNLGSLGATSPAGWSFPLGTNSDSFSSFWYFVDGRIRPTPRDAAREMRAAGGPMFAAPGLSRLWAAAESDGSRVLTWENLFVGNDTNTPVNAQIRLYANGDFTTCSNAVVTACRRVEPFDWDDDGLANEIDPEPYANNGDCHGQGEGWVEACFTKCNKMITHEGTNYVVNPCCIVRGGRDAWFEVDVSPADYPDSQIVWECSEPQVQFIGGNIGRRVRLRATPSCPLGALVSLTVRFGNCPSNTPMFYAETTGLVRIRLYHQTLIGTKDVFNTYNDSEIQRLDDIYSQVGIRFLHVFLPPKSAGRDSEIQFSGSNSNCFAPESCSEIAAMTK